MGRFDKYMLHQLLLLFGLFSLILVLVFWVNKAVILLDTMMGNGQSITMFLRVSTLGLPTIIADVLPITAFIATVFAVNRMSSESELVVVQAAGFSPWRLARPVLIVGILVTLRVAMLTHVIGPMAEKELALRKDEMSRDVTSKLLTEGTFIHPTKGLTFYVREISPAGELLDIFLSDNRSDKNRVFFLAQKALIIKDNDGPVLLMFDGESHNYSLASTKLAVTTFDSFAYGLGEFFGETQTPARPLKARTTFDLLQASGVGAGQTTPDTALTIRKTIHERTARAMLALIAPLIGFGALIAGGFSRFGLWRQIFLAFTLLVVVKSVDSAGISAARRALENWPLLYASILTGLGVTGLLLTYAADPKKWRTMLHRKSEASQ
mgnify:CR=1 FL=1